MMDVSTRQVPEAYQELGQLACEQPNRDAQKVATLALMTAPDALPSWHWEPGTSTTANHP